MPDEMSPEELARYEEVRSQYSGCIIALYHVKLERIQ